MKTEKTITTTKAVYTYSRPMQWAVATIMSDRTNDEAVIAQFYSETDARLFVDSRPRRHLEVRKIVPMTDTLTDTTMTWEQKVQALQCLGTVSFHMREPSKWTVVVKELEIKQGGCLTTCQGSGSSPQYAIMDLWEKLINLPSNQHIVMNAFSDKRKSYKWAGFMWKEVDLDA